MKPDFRRRKPSSRPTFQRKKDAGKADWRRHEQDVAQRSGSSPQPGSGNNPIRPGDAVNLVFLRECKATKRGGIKIEAAWLKKITDAAISRGRIPLVELRLEGHQPPVPTDWVLIPAVEFEELTRGLDH